jgi:hypothetical protein
MTYTVAITVQVEAESRHEAYAVVLQTLARTRDVAYIDSEVIAETTGAEPEAESV